MVTPCSRHLQNSPHFPLGSYSELCAHGILLGGLSVKAFSDSNQRCLGFNSHANSHQPGELGVYLGVLICQMGISTVITQQD